MPYDPNIRYFGPQGSKLCAIIPEYPKGIPQARNIFNIPAYSHDKGYEGERRKGFFGWIKDAIERRKIDKEFLSSMLDGISSACDRGILSPEEADECDDYAYLAYDAVRIGGWAFFRKK